VTNSRLSMTLNECGGVYENEKNETRRGRQQKNDRGSQEDREKVWRWPCSYLRWIQAP
jgi:hypothetical protein